MKTLEELVNEIHIALYGTKGMKGILQRLERVEKVIDENVVSWAFWRGARRYAVTVLTIVSGGGLLALLGWWLKLFATH